MTPAPRGERPQHERHCRRSADRLPWVLVYVSIGLAHCAIALCLSCFDGIFTEPSVLVGVNALAREFADCVGLLSMQSRGNPYVRLSAE